MNCILTLHNDINEVPFLAEWIEQIGFELGLPMSAVFQLNLALEEAVVNVMNYAYPGQTGMPVELSVQPGEEYLTFVLVDQGVAFDPLQAEAPDIDLDAEARPIGGLGIFLVTQMMDKVGYERKDDRNILTMTYKVPTEDSLDLLAELTDE